MALVHPFENKRCSYHKCPLFWTGVKVQTIFGHLFFHLIKVWPCIHENNWVFQNIFSMWWVHLEVWSFVSGERDIRQIDHFVKCFYQSFLGIVSREHSSLSQSVTTTGAWTNNIWAIFVVWEFFLLCQVDSRKQIPTDFLRISEYVMYYIQWYNATDHCCNNYMELGKNWE